MRDICGICAGRGARIIMDFHLSGFRILAPKMTEWYNYCASAQWGTPHALKADIRTASILKNNRVVFNLCGNKYRIVVLMDYIRHGMLIRFVGTHRQYDEIDDIENI